MTSRVERGRIPILSSTGTIEGYVDEHRLVDINDPSVSPELRAEYDAAVQKARRAMENCRRIDELTRLQEENNKEIKKLEDKSAECDKQIGIARKMQEEARKGQEEARKMQEAGRKMQEAGRAQKIAALDRKAVCDYAIQAIDEAESQGRAITKQEIGQKLTSEGDRRLMLGTLTKMIFPQFDTKNKATRDSEIEAAKKVVEAFSDTIVATLQQGHWEPNNSKMCPHLNKSVIQELILPILTTLKRGEVDLDLSKFKDEVDIEPTVEMILNNKSPKIRQVTFGDFSEDQMTILAKAISTTVRAKEPNFTFSTEELNKKFFGILRSVTPVSKAPPKPLPAPKASKPAPIPPAKPSTVSSKTVVQTGVPKVITSGNGSPPKAEAY